MTRSNQHYNDDLTCLLIRAGQGDTKAFEQLHAALLPAVLDYLASLDGSMGHHQQEDMVQEVFLRTWSKLSRFRGEASAKTFVFAIAKNVLQEELSRRRRLRIVHTGDLDHLEDTYVPDGPTGKNGLDHVGLSEAIEQAKARLSSVQRQALELKHLHNLPIMEIAKLAGCGYGQFRDRLYRARKRLKQLLKDLPLCILL